MLNTYRYLLTLCMIIIEPKDTVRKIKSKITILIYNLYGIVIDETI